MAVFQDFQWKSSVQDAEFKKINILYGRNYSGKTTLSRIFRAFETGEISKEYESSEFKLNLENSDDLTQDSLKTHNQLIRVFNKDFVKENLQFIIDDTQSIKSFAILGEDNTRIKNDIEKHEAELGSDDNATGLIGQYFAAKKQFENDNNRYNKQNKELEDQLKHKANNEQTGIKHNTLFKKHTYNVPKLKEDIKAVSDKSYSPCTKEQASEFHILLKEEKKKTIQEFNSFTLQYSTIASDAKELIGKKIQTSEPIQDLLNDAILTQWVREGRKHHEEKNRDTCGFCGNDLPEDLWEKLDKHFNQESEDLRQALNNFLGSIEQERSRFENLLKINTSDFHSKFTPDLTALEKQLSTLSTSYNANLDSIKEQVEKRKNDIFKPFEFDTPDSIEEDLNKVRNALEELRNASNDLTTSMSTKQSEAREILRRHDVYTFMKDIKYKDKLTNIDLLKNVKNEADKDQTAIKEKVDAKQKGIAELKAQLKDESKGANRVNDYLNNFFGHQFISLKAIEETPYDASSGYRFEVTRNNKKALHLSEGECSLIAFCYFMATLEDIETKGNQPIIWIDDPISSLDANHIFFVYSLINEKIATPEKSKDDEEQYRFKQLFISTHNLDFLKYLKRLPGAGNKTNSQYFMIITRKDQVSDIALMPRYMKDYVTEFNFLFHQIYKCAHAQIECEENHDCYYNFGNNARKFLEAFLYYKYPNAVEKDNKLARFFNDDAFATAVTDRINHEFSHLSGIVERSVSPIDVPEMKTTANFILKKIKDNDPAQYDAFLQSIGETE